MTLDEVIQVVEALQATLQKAEARLDVMAESLKDHRVRLAALEAGGGAR